MQVLMKKLKHFWYYYKVYVMIAAAAVACFAYFTYQNMSAPDMDYHIGLISTGPWSLEDVTQLENRFAAAGQDINGDGQVLVQVHLYRVDLADPDPNAGVKNHEIVAALDADLIGGISGIFLTEDPQTLQDITAGLMEEAFCSYDRGLYLVLSRKADDRYRQLLDALT